MKEPAWHPPKLTDPGEFAIIRRIYFEPHELTDDQDRADKKQKKLTNYSR